MGLRKKKSESVVSRAGWEVGISATLQRGNDAYYYDMGRDRSRRVDDSVSVRLYFNGQPRVTFGSVRITDDDFEDKITTLKAGAQERAAALTAVDAR